MILKKMTRPTTNELYYSSLVFIIFDKIIGKV